MTDDQRAETDEPQVTRRQVTKGAGVAAGSAMTPLSFMFTGSNALTPAAVEFVQAERYGAVFGFEQSVKRYSGNPSWPVSVSEDELDALHDWADESDERTIVREHAATDTATVSAPIADMAGRVLDEGLEAESWVEWVDVDMLVSKVEPPRLPGDEDDHPEFTRAQQFVMSDDPAPTGGLAFEAEGGTLADGRDTSSDTNVVETGAGHTLGVIDTGLTYDSDYVERARLLDASVNLTLGDEPTVGNDGTDAVADGNDHGTWVAMAAAGNPTDETYEGVAPGADLLVMKALDDEGSGATATIAHAVRYGVDNGADVLCMSLGAPFHSRDLANALQYAHDEGVLVVVAAGNDRPVTRFAAYPASDLNTLAVSATTTGTSSEVQSAHFANIGPATGTQDFSEGETAGAEVGMAAPGMNLEADLPGGYKTLSGTSMAAPFVAGAAVVTLEADGSLAGDAEALRTRLEESAAPAEQLAAAESAHGLLDVAAAVSGTEPDEEQADVMDSQAAARDAGYRAESAARGGWAARVLF